jgi:hypothetical protein
MQADSPRGVAVSRIVINRVAEVVRESERAAYGVAGSYVVATRGVWEHSGSLNGPAKASLSWDGQSP